MGLRSTIWMAAIVAVVPACGSEVAPAGDAGTIRERPGTDAGTPPDADRDDGSPPDDATTVRDARTCHAYEQCANGRDDDCDGEVDEGCILEVLLSDRADGTEYGGSGGTAFSRVCYRGQVARGLYGTAGTSVDRIGLLCASIWVIIADTDEGREYKVAVDPTVHGLLIGGAGDPSFELGCPEGQVLSGIFGSADGSLRSIGVRCVWPVVTEASDGMLRLSLEPGTRLGPEGGSAGTSFEYACGGTRVAIGMHGRAGTDVDRFGLICERAAVED